MTHRIASLLAMSALAACGGGGGPTGNKQQQLQPVPTPLPVTSVRAQGNKLLNAAGAQIRLRGVNHSGSEYACIQGWGMFDGQVDAAGAGAIAAWKANVVRVPLNESCWLGINGVKPEYGGASYQQAIAGYVSRLNAAGLAVILELHWTGTGITSATGQQPMPSREHTPEFWRQVAAAYKGNQAVIFDLFNEPFPDNSRDTPEAWRCWREGGTCAGMTYQAAGMQELVDAVRSTGAANLIMAGGVQYANSLAGWLANRPNDPLNNLAASWHVYNNNPCTTRACWDAYAGPVAAQVPLVLGELGDNTSGSAFISSLMDWMDARQGSYLAWVWNLWGSPLDLISDYGGTPTAYGQTFKTRLGS